MLDGITSVVDARGRTQNDYGMVWQFMLRRQQMFHSTCAKPHYQCLRTIGYANQIFVRNVHNNKN